jgi:hypothetical protein
MASRRMNNLEFLAAIRRNAAYFKMKQVGGGMDATIEQKIGSWQGEQPFSRQFPPKEPWRKRKMLRGRNDERVLPISEGVAEKEPKALKPPSAQPERDEEVPS